MEQVKGDQRFAVLLCSLRADTPVERQPRQFFEDLFVNNSEDGLNRYWQDASHGNISLDGSQVFGWRELPQTLAEFNSISSRYERIRTAAEHFAKEGDDQVDFRSFTGIIVVTDQSGDLGSPGRGPLTYKLNGESRPYRGLICDQNDTHEAIAHEIGHSFGLDHSFSTRATSCDPANDGRAGAYCDLWDIMSGQLSISVEKPRFSSSGPLMNAVNMSLLGWLHDSRVRRFTGNSDSKQLRPLSRPDLPGALAIQADSLLVEFRMNKGWDEGFGRPGVLIHKADYQYPPEVPDDQHSVVVGRLRRQYLREGESYAEGDSRFGPYLQVSVTDIDPANESATISLLRKAREGVTDELGILQWIVEGIIGVSPQGRVVIVPPRPPIRDILIGVAMNELAQAVEDNENRAALSQASMNLIAETARKEMGH
jgi:M6 family metalloprotease-like protein